MFLAEGTSTGIDPFDWFMLAFTIIIAIGFVRLVTQKSKKNLFAIGFSGVALLLFLFIDFVMIKEVWLGL